MPEPIPSIRSVFAVVLAWTAGCGGVTTEISSPPPDGGTDAFFAHDAAHAGLDGSSTVGCSTDSECQEGYACAWPTSSDSCLARGTCVHPLDLPCPDPPPTFVTACGCGGQSFSWHEGCGALPPGWAPKPSLHQGFCNDAGPGCTNNGCRVCSTNEDCGAGDACMFEISEGCSARGLCVETSTLPMCNCAGLPACGCNGATTYISCCSEGYASTPIAYTGACGDAAP
jgi:hypothetical protein